MVLAERITAIRSSKGFEYLRKVTASGYSFLTIDRYVLTLLSFPYVILADAGILAYIFRNDYDLHLLTLQSDIDILRFNSGMWPSG